MFRHQLNIKSAIAGFTIRSHKIAIAKHSAQAQYQAMIKNFLGGIIVCAQLTLRNGGIILAEYDVDILRRMESELQGIRCIFCFVEYAHLFITRREHSLRILFFAPASEMCLLQSSVHNAYICTTFFQIRYVFLCFGDSVLSSGRSMTSPSASATHFQRFLPNSAAT